MGTAGRLHPTTPGGDPPPPDMPPKSPESPLLQPEKHVLSTLEADGSRRWLRPKLSKGAMWKRRRVVAYLLLAVYSGLPWLKIAGKPAVLIDLPGRELTLFGMSFLATDTVILALAVLVGFLSIFFMTALFGRVWCGWACPQTVYMEFVFRPIERLFMGTKGKGGKPKKVAPWRTGAMYATYFVICLHLAQTFMAYFVGAENIRQWVWSSPLEHPASFTIVAALTVAMMIDFAFWREQLCIIGCPYGRLQSVLLDRSSTIVAYDEGRGEPRAPLRKSDGGSFENRGSCVDCSMCVQVCPTGIDIRQGLQMECIHCTQCADACDDIMERTNQPKGLIRYTSQAALEGEQQGLLRPRVVIYGSLISGLSILLLGLVAHVPHADVTLLRSLGQPYGLSPAGDVQNTMRLKIHNRTDANRTYYVEPVAPVALRLTEETRSSFSLDSGETVTEPMRLVLPRDAFRSGRVPATLRVTDDEGWTVDKKWTLIGPAGGPPPPPE